MDYPNNTVPWVDANYRLPEVSQFGPYPHVIVATQYVDHPQWGFGQQYAELRFLGKNPRRPLWCKPGGLVPLETEAIVVRYWTPALMPPAG